jgi:hypothetical protein
VGFRGHNLSQSYKCFAPSLSPSKPTHANKPGLTLSFQQQQEQHTSMNMHVMILGQLHCCVLCCNFNAINWLFTCHWPHSTPPA